MGNQWLIKLNFTQAKEEYVYCCITPPIG